MASPQLYTVNGIVLKRTNSGEGDKILTVLCEHVGKKRFVGKGIRKITSRRAGHIELFSKTNFLIHRGKTLDYISGASVFSAYGTSYKELYQLAGAYTASEVIDRMIMEGQIHDQVYVQFDQFLHDMETIAFSHVSGHLKLFIDTLLMNLGYQTEEKRSLTLGHGIASVEQVIERKIRSVNLLSKSGMNMF